MHKRRGGTWCYFVLALATSPTQVFAAEYYLEPSVKARYEFDNNRSLSEPTESASIWRFSPLVKFGRLTPSSTILGTARVDVNESNREALDSTNLFFGLLPTYRTERSLWSLDATYRRDTTLRTDIFEPDFGQEPLPADSALAGTDEVTAPPETAAGTEIPGEDIPDLDDPNQQDSDLGLRAQEVQRNLLVLSPVWRRELTPRMGLGLRYRYVDTFYSDAEGTGLVDSRRHSGSADLSYRWSEVDDISVITSVQNFQNDESSEFDTYRFELGWRHRFSDTLRAVATGGPEYTDEGGSGGDSNLGFSFRLGVSKRLESSDLGIFFRRAVAPSEDGNALERNQIDVRWLGDISPRWSFAFLARAFRNEDAGDSASGSRDRSYAQVEPTISYALTENIYVDLGYRFRWQDTDESVFAHAVALSVGYRLDRFGFSR
ncbi:MAG: hypothetical protein ACREXR_13725 [Gammaproteobacteria bacterium]